MSWNIFAPRRITPNVSAPTTPWATAIIDTTWMKGARRDAVEAHHRSGERRHDKGAVQPGTLHGFQKRATGGGHDSRPGLAGGAVHPRPERKDFDGAVLRYYILRP